MPYATPMFWFVVAALVVAAIVLGIRPRGPHGGG